MHIYIFIYVYVKTYEIDNQTFILQLYILTYTNLPHTASV